MIKMYYDTHCHLNLLSEKELNTALTDASEENVTKMISCSTSFHSNKQNLLLSKKFEQINAAIGLYPLDGMELNSKELDIAFGFFKKHISDAIAIGEVGLDHKYTKTNLDKEKQKELFTRFIDLSKEYDKPLIIHSRYAQRTVLEILESERAEKVLLHSFIESKKLMKIASENNWYVGVGMNILSDSQVMQNIIEFPIENLLFETDSPIRFNGEKAMPKNIIQIANKVAELKEIDLNQLELQQEKNYAKLFS
jgi:TatD DNase family protein